VATQIEIRAERTLAADNKVVLVFPGMAGRVVGRVAMLVRRNDADKPFLTPSGWQATPYRWLSDRVRNDGFDLIVPLEQSATRLLDDLSHLHIVLPDIDVEGMTAGKVRAAPKSARGQPSLVSDPSQAASPPRLRRRLVVPLAMLGAIGSMGLGGWIYEALRPAPLESTGSTTYLASQALAQPSRLTAQPQPIEPRTASFEPALPPVPMPPTAAASAPSGPVLLAAAEVTGARIELTGGKVIIGNIIASTEETYTVRTVRGETVSIPVMSILTVDGRIPGAVDPTPARPELTAALIPELTALRLTGSNTIGAKLAPALAVAYLKSQGAGASINQDVAPEESAVDAAPPVAGVPTHIAITAHGSATAFKALGAGETDIGMASRPITQEESADLARLGDMTSATSEHVLALDGLAVIVHPANPIPTLTKDQLAQIFCGKVQDWAVLGGKPGPIAIYARDNKSGTFDTFKNLVLGGCALAGTARRFESSEELSGSVAADPGGIGFIGFAYVGHSRAIPIAECQLRYPASSFTVKTEEYPLSRRLFLYTPSQHAAAIDDFVSYTRSDAAQQVVAANGFIDLGIELDTAETQTARKAWALSNAVRIETLKKFGTVTAGATRLSVTFRFRKNSADLDNRAVVDLGRLKNYLGTPGAQGRQLLLLGFSDRDGSYRTNVELSRQRAKSIAAKLGIPHVETYGFGPEAPVACNTTPDGQDKNRHVEAWLR
jgi:phosphate transport system substrate-binding protein